MKDEVFMVYMFYVNLIKINKSAEELVITTRLLLCMDYIEKQGSTGSDSHHRMSV